MNLIYSNNIEEIKKIVETKAKFQKVLLLHDDTITTSEIDDIYNVIKNLCIYNQMDLNNIDNNELYNGYRIVIYLCNADNYLKTNINKAEFINVFMPRDKGLLPYFLQDEFYKSSKDYLLIDANNFDTNIVLSLYLNKFYNYLKAMLTLQHTNLEYLSADKEFTQFKVVEEIENLNEDFEFLDIKILKFSNLEYKFLPLLDLILIDAFLCFILSVKRREYALVDVYKEAKDNYALIDKFYKMYNNDSVINLMTLNYNCLYNFCLKTKQKILDCYTLYDYDENKVNEIIKIVKEFAKQTDDVMAYLFLYNMFNI